MSNACVILPRHTRALLRAWIHSLYHDIQSTEKNWKGICLMKFSDTMIHAAPRQVDESQYVSWYIAANACAKFQDLLVAVTIDKDIDMKWYYHWDHVICLVTTSSVPRLWVVTASTLQNWQNEQPDCLGVTLYGRCLLKNTQVPTMSRNCRMWRWIRTKKACNNCRVSSRECDFCSPCNIYVMCAFEQWALSQKRDGIPLYLGMNHALQAANTLLDFNGTEWSRVSCTLYGIDNVIKQLVCFNVVSVFIKV